MRRPIRDRSIVKRVKEASCDKMKDCFRQIDHEITHSLITHYVMYTNYNLSNR